MNNANSLVSPPSKTLARGLEILEHIALANRSMRLKDVAEAFDMDMASAHRILKTLEEMGFIDRLAVGRTYGAGQKLRSLADPLRPTKRIVDALRSLVPKLTESTRHVAHVGILQRSQVVLAEVALTETAKLRTNAITARTKFYPHTEFTLQTKLALRRSLADIKTTKIAFDDREDPPTSPVLRHRFWIKQVIRLPPLGSRQFLLLLKVLLLIRRDSLMQ
ncbi:helix-turn-helix domain-containing protein [Sulfitobacter sp.]|uniref:helix-turn-helix domain-containing protein n=1 Tax=Sulfitobacter sp. TaxID=1903071 RepID=UPI003003A5C7